MSCSLQVEVPKPAPTPSVHLLGYEHMNVDLGVKKLGTRSDSSVIISEHMNVDLGVESPLENRDQLGSCSVAKLAWI